MLDVEFADKNVFEEFGVFIDGQVFGYSFNSPTSFQATFQTHWCTNNLHKIDWRRGARDYNDVTKILTSLKQYRAEYIAKRLKKCTMLSALLGKQVENFDDYGCPEIQNSIVTGCVPAITTDIEQHFTALKKRQKRLVHGLCNHLIGDLMSIVLFQKEKLN